MALYGYFNGFVLLTPQLDMRVHALKLSLFKTLNEENKDCMNIVTEIFK